MEWSPQSAHRWRISRHQRRPFDGLLRASAPLASQRKSTPQLPDRMVKKNDDKRESSRVAHYLFRCTPLTKWIAAIIQSQYKMNTSLMYRAVVLACVPFHWSQSTDNSFPNGFQCATAIELITLQWVYCNILFAGNVWRALSDNNHIYLIY